MSSRTVTIPFQPAPRPQSRVSPEQTRELADATRDLGFGRTTSAPAEAPPELEPPKTAPAAPAPIEVQVGQRTSASTPVELGTAARIPKTATALEKMATLKVAMPDEIWNALRLEALNRRVTVKYLVMEALAAKGYHIDLSKVAEDGRRLR